MCVVLHTSSVLQWFTLVGLIHRNHRPVYYSPSSRSALAEAELVYTDNHVSHSVYVSFQVDATPDLWARIPGMESCTAKVGLLVWTTTPWTLSANMVSTNLGHVQHESDSF